MTEAFLIGAAVIGIATIAALLAVAWIEATDPIHGPEPEPNGMAEPPRHEVVHDYTRWML